MDKLKEKFNPIQYKYVYEVCRRLAPHLFELDCDMNANKRSDLILKCLMNAFFDVDEFLDFLNQTTIIDVNKTNNEALELCDDEALILKAYESFNSLFLPSDFTNRSHDVMPYNTIYSFVNNYITKDEYIHSFNNFRFNYTCNEKEFFEILNSLKIVSDNKLKELINEENKKMTEIIPDPILYRAIRYSITKSKKMDNGVDYVKGLLKGIRDNANVLDERRKHICFSLGDFNETDPIKNELTLDEIELVKKFALVPKIENMCIEDYLDYLDDNNKFDVLVACQELNFDQNQIRLMSNLKKMFEIEERERKERLKKNNPLKYELEDKVNKVKNIVIPKLQYSNSLEIYSYGEKQLKDITTITNEISSLITDTVKPNFSLIECINGVIPKLTIIEKLNIKKSSKKYEEGLNNTKSNLIFLEENLKVQIQVYEYLTRIYRLKLEKVDHLEEEVKKTLSEETNPLYKKWLEQKLQNIFIVRESTLVMLNQVDILANNHLNVLNMLYRTKETFLTVIEGQTLINSSIAAEKAALKNIKNIVNIYDCALNEDFSSAFTLMKDLKNNGLDDYSYAQLQDNITNIQSLFNPNVIDEKEENKPAKKPAVKKRVSTRTVTPRTVQAKTLYAKPAGENPVTIDDNNIDNPKKKILEPNRDFKLPVRHVEG